MRTIVAGSRTLNYNDVLKAIKECGWVPTVIISGGALGIDQAGETYANLNNIPLEVYKANWQRYGRGAGYVRNSLMISKAEAAIVVWDGKSKGSLHCAKEATRKGLKVYLTQAEPTPKTKPKFVKGIEKVVLE